MISCVKGLKDKIKNILIIAIATFIASLLSGMPYCTVTRQWERPVLISLGDKYDEGMLEGVMIGFNWGGMFIGTYLVAYGDSEKARWLGLGLMIFGAILLYWANIWKLRT